MASLTFVGHLEASYSSIDVEVEVEELVVASDLVESDFFPPDVVEFFLVVEEFADCFWDVWLIWSETDVDLTEFDFVLSQPTSVRARSGNKRIFFLFIGIILLAYKDINTIFKNQIYMKNN